MLEVYLEAPRSGYAVFEIVKALYNPLYGVGYPAWAEHVIVPLLVDDDLGPPIISLGCPAAVEPTGSQPDNNYLWRVSAQIVS
jgi:hypothetical protein